jgi:CHASE3 domain sensor protein
MKNMAVRLTLVCLFVVASSVAAYLVWTGESLAGRDVYAARQFEHAAFAVEQNVLDLRAAQQAYVAAGQGDEFWISKAAAAAVAVRAALDALRAQAFSPEAQSVIDNASSALEDFEQMDRRARDYTRSGQKLLASDLIFTDGLESTGVVVESIDRARAAEVQARDAALADTRRAEIIAIGVAGAVGLVVILLLLPRRQAVVRAEPVTKFKTGPPAPLDAFDLRPAVDPTPATKPETVEPAPSPSSLDLDAVASLCTDLARVVETRALPAILGRAATVLDAPGIVLWIADPDGHELSPIVTHGYSQQMVARLGTILRDAENATASAFRTSLMQIVDADAVSNGAIAAPLVTPAGCVGVMAAEVRHEGEKDSGKLAAATIVAAQLATLVGPPSTRAQARADAM